MVGKFYYLNVLALQTMQWNFSAKDVRSETDVSNRNCRKFAKNAT